MTGGETCADALSLLSTSATLPAGSSYSHRLDGTFGATDDYSPYKGDGLPPECSLVYPAPGLDRVYTIDLQAGQTLVMQLELNTYSKQPALYVLTNCATPTILDGDNSGACGSNEYAVGNYTPTGYDSSQLQFTNHLASPRTVWVVVDQGQGLSSASFAPATGFTMRWRLQ